VLVEDYRATYESREEAEQLQPLSPTAVARDRRRGPGPPRGPWLVIGLAVLAVVGALLVIGLVGGDDEGGGGDGGQASGTTTEETTPKTQTKEEQQPAPPKRVVLRITPANEVYVCVDSGPGTDIQFNGIISEPQTFRGRKLRVNLGKTDVEVTKNGKAVQIEPGPEAVGFAFTPRSTKPIPLGERPCA
jgi:hypothetical protein